MAIDYEQIYNQHAHAYDRLVAAEDYQQQLLPAIEAVTPIAGKAILEVGAGTGRVTRLLAARAANIVAVDRSKAMLHVAQEHLTASSAASWLLIQAEGEQLPVVSGWADLAIAGWVFGHLRFWLPAGWQHAIAQAIAEMERSLKPGGSIIILETLGTGSAEPLPPNAELAEYYDRLETVHGFSRRALRTDYRFASVDEAVELTEFFFGAELSQRIRRERRQDLPECTGLWWKRVGSSDA